ncbi:hypothetical protein Tco_0327097 [Tanacetum coccineum]
MLKSNNDKKNVNAFKRTARISVRACYLVNPRPTYPPYQNLSPPTDYKTAPPLSPIVSPPPSLITSPGISPCHLLNTPKTTPPPLTSLPPAPSQPSKQTSPLAINLDPVELIFSTPPTSPHPFFNSLENSPPRTTNLPPPQPSFKTIERLANQPPPLPVMEPHLPPMPPLHPPLGPNNPFPVLTHEMFCDHCQRTQVTVHDLCEEIRRGPMDWERSPVPFNIEGRFHSAHGTGCKSEIEYTKVLLQKEFDMKELGPTRKILGMEIVTDTVDLCAIGSILQGSLMYLMVCTILDIAYAASIVSDEFSKSRKHVDVDSFVDADYAFEPDKGRSITKYVFMVHGCVVSWKATLQYVVALSTTEAEYMALIEAVKESIWLKEDEAYQREISLHQGDVESKEIEVAKIGMEDNTYN